MSGSTTGSGLARKLIDASSAQGTGKWGDPFHPELEPLHHRKIVLNGVLEAKYLFEARRQNIVSH